MRSFRTSIHQSLERIDAWWFQPVSTLGFGAMRIGFAFSALVTMLSQWHLVEFFYGPSGMLPRSFVPIVLRPEYRFSLIDFLGTFGTQALFLILLLALTLVLLGIWTRFSLIISLVLLFSFHEYGTITLDGGDTMQRLIGFLLLLSPCDRSLSLRSFFRRIRAARQTGKDQSESARRMPIWPYRLLLWQMICLYTAAAISKWSGSTWLDGSAMAISLHHEHFTRLSPLLRDLATYVSPAGSLFVLLTQSAWILLLIVPILERYSPAIRGSTAHIKRFLLCCGLLIHGMIFLLMDVGMFSVIMFAGYAGLLLDDDFEAIRGCFNRSRAQKTIVLYDGRCGLCSATLIVLRMCDWLHRLTFVDYHDPAMRALYAPKVPLSTLHSAIHVRIKDGTLLRGFFACRSLCLLLPPLWPLVLIAWLPGMAWIGSRVYESIAHRRQTKPA